MALVFTNIGDVRRESGFSNNQDISDKNDVLLSAETAEGEVISYCSQKYKTPLEDNPNWEGSPAQSLLKGVATRLASGLLLMKVYDGQGGAALELADIKVSQARKVLHDIALRGSAKGLSLILYGSNGAQLAPIASSSVMGLPISNVGLTQAKVSINDEF